MRKFLKNPCNVYTLGWCLYYLQGTLYAYGSIFAKVLLVALLLYSLYYFASNYRIFANRYFKSALLFIAVFALYSVIHLAVGATVISDGVAKSKLDSIKMLLISLVPVFCYYGFAVKGYLDEEWLKKWSAVLLALAVCSYYREQNERLKMAIEEGSTKEEFTNNTGYMFAGLIPMLLLVKSRQVYKYLLLSVSLIFTVMSMKRGAMLVAAIMAVIFLIYDIKSNRRTSKIRIFLLGAGLVTAMFFAVRYIVSNSDFFVHRMEQTMSGDSSGRIGLYSSMLGYFFDQSSIFRFLFGNGINGTDLIFGYGAHNDWLEFAIDMGLFGLIVYFMYWVSLLRTWRNSRHIEGVVVAFGMIVLMELLKSMFSFSINNMPIQMVPVLGYCIACVEMKCRNNG